MIQFSVRLPRELHRAVRFIAADRNVSINQIVIEALQEATAKARISLPSELSTLVLDDAQGYGYRNIQKAYAAYGYKTRDKSKDAEKRAKKRHILKWLNEHKEFDGLMEAVAFDCVKCCEPFNAGLVKGMLKANNLNPDFTAGELLKVWNSRRE